MNRSKSTNLSTGTLMGPKVSLSSLNPVEIDRTNADRSIAPSNADDELRRRDAANIAIYRAVKG